MSSREILGMALGIAGWWLTIRQSVWDRPVARGVDYPVAANGGAAALERSAGTAWAT